MDLQNILTQRTESLINSSVVEIFQPKLFEILPFADIKCIEKLFTCLSLDNILLLFRRVLLDTSNILISSDKESIIMCCEAIRSLIYPYKYE